jgi:ligand-binding sensor domain-containing protein
MIWKFGNEVIWKFMTKKLLIFGFLLQLLITFPSAGQKNNYYQKIFTIRDGLPINNVEFITQDQSGFLWIGTWDGLVRYDGSEFKVYRHDPNDSTSLGYFEVALISVDDSNNVWTFSGNKICRYERNHDHFITYDSHDFSDAIPSITPPVVSFAYLDSEGQLYVRFKNSLYKYDRSKDHFSEIFLKKAGIDMDFFNNTAVDNEGISWIFLITPGKDDGRAYQFSIDSNDTLSITNTYAVERKFFEGKFQNVSFHLKIFRNSSGNTWMATNHGLFKLENDTIREFRGKIPPGEFSGVDMVIWTQFGKGLMVYYPGDGSQDTIFKPDEVENIVAYHADKQHNIWFTNYNSNSTKNGLGLMYRTESSFNQYLKDKNDAIPSIVYGLVKDKAGNIWAGGRPNDNIIKINPDGEIIKVKIPIDSIGYYNYPRDMALDPEGNIWIAFYNDYLYKLNPNNLEFIDYSSEGILKDNTYFNPKYRLVSTLHDGRLITGGRGRIYILDRGDFTGTIIDNPTLIDSYSFYEDDSGNIWSGFNGLLLKLSEDLTKQEKIFFTDNYYNIEDICPGDSSDLWLAMLGGGIGHYVPKTGKTTYFTTYNGLANNTVYSILKDRSGNLWASHDLGISMLNPITKNIVNFNEKDGLHVREFDSEAAFQTSDGEMLFGGIGGIVSFYPDSVKLNRQETPTQLMITEFRVSNITADFNLPVNDLETVNLPKGSDNFQLEFVKPDLRYGEEIRYKYKLTGISDDWIITDSRHRKVNYTSLRPGKYKFLAEATDLKGEWKYKTSLIIDIQPFFHQTLLFKILMVILSLGILLLLFIMKLNQIRLNEKKKQEQLKLETLRGQMNPHFLYNSLNSINFFISSNDRLNANEYITGFSRLMRSVLTNSSQDFISLEAEVQTLKDYLALEHLRFGDKFDFELKVEDAIDQINTEVIPSLAQPFIENAIWHGMRYLEGRKGFLSVRFVMESEFSLLCYVEDDGVGRKLSVKLKSGEQKKRRSRGMAIVAERLELINSFHKTKYTVDVANLFDDREETGTKVKIDIPFRSV